MTNELTHDQFWQFSCQCYAHQDIALHALSLQDQHGVNVNMLLFLCWCLKNRQVLDLEAFSQLAKAIRASETVLAEHRQLRRDQHPDNGGDADVYAAHKTQELQLERQQQQALVTQFQQFENVTSLPEQAGNSILNASIAAFIHCYQLKDDASARRHISAVVSQIASLQG